MVNQGAASFQCHPARLVSEMEPSAALICLLESASTPPAVARILLKSSAFAKTRQPGEFIIMAPIKAAPKPKATKNLPPKKTLAIKGGVSRTTNPSND
jgi:hypothetical protein